MQESTRPQPSRQYVYSCACAGVSWLVVLHVSSCRRTAWICRGAESSCRRTVCTCRQTICTYRQAADRASRSSAVSVLITCRSPNCPATTQSTSSRASVVTAWSRADQPQTCSITRAVTTDLAATASESSAGVAERMARDVERQASVVNRLTGGWQRVTALSWLVIGNGLAVAFTL